MYICDTCCIKLQRNGFRPHAASLGANNISYHYASCSVCGGWDTCVDRHDLSVNAIKASAETAIRQRAIDTAREAILALSKARRIYDTMAATHYSDRTLSYADLKSACDVVDVAVSAAIRAQADVDILDAQQGEK